MIVTGDRLLGGVNHPMNQLTRPEAIPQRHLESRPIVVPLADTTRFKHYVGLSPARARKLHLTEGFPLRFRGDGARRSAYVIVEELAAWWKRQQCE